MNVFFLRSVNGFLLVDNNWQNTDFDRQFLVLTSSTTTNLIEILALDSRTKSAYETCRRHTLQHTSP